MIKVETVGSHLPFNAFKANYDENQNWIDDQNAELVFTTLMALVMSLRPHPISTFRIITDGVTSSYAVNG